MKGKSDVGAYNDLDRDTSMDPASQHQAVSPLSSFGFAVNNESNGLGSAIELSAAGAGVVPDGMFIPLYVASISFFIFHEYISSFRYIYSGPGSECNR